MQNLTRWLGVAALAMLLSSALAVYAQDATPVPADGAAAEATADSGVAEATVEAGTSSTSSDHSMTDTAGGSVMCDSDLVLSLYIAERYFGFGGVASMLTGDQMLDLTQFDKGQYGPLFDTSMTTMPTTTLSPEQMQSTASLMMMDEATLMAQMASMMPADTDVNSLSMLNAATISGEDASCTLLRNQLNRFYSILAFQDMQMGMSMSAGTGVEATPDAAASSGSDTSGDMNAEATADASASTNGSTTAGTTDSGAANANFGTMLSGMNEVPGPGDTDGTGSAAVTLDMTNGQVCYNVSVQNVALPATGAHIHRGAAGESGPVVVPFDALPDANGTAVSCVLVDGALLQEIAANPAGFYVNIHTSEFPDGAVRGQVSG